MSPKAQVIERIEGFFCRQSNNYTA